MSLAKPLAHGMTKHRDHLRGGSGGHVTGLGAGDAAISRMREAMGLLLKQNRIINNSSLQ